MCGEAAYLYISMVSAKRIEFIFEDTYEKNGGEKDEKKISKALKVS